MASSPEQNQHQRRKRVEESLLKDGFRLDFEQIWKDADNITPDLIKDYLRAALQPLEEGKDETAVFFATTRLALVLEGFGGVEDEELSALLSAFSSELQDFLLGEVGENDLSAMRYHGLMRVFTPLRRHLSPEAREDFDESLQILLGDEDYSSLYKMLIKHFVPELSKKVEDESSSEGNDKIIGDTRRDIEDTFSDDSDFPGEI